MSESSRKVRRRQKAVSATEAQNNFGQLLDAVQKHDVVVEKFGRPAAVLLSPDRYDTLCRTAESKDVNLAVLEREFDDIVEQMQTLEAAEGADRFFAMSADMVGGIAHEAQRPRGKTSRNATHETAKPTRRKARPPSRRRS